MSHLSPSVGTDGDITLAELDEPQMACYVLPNSVLKTIPIPAAVRTLTLISKL